ncbi:MAG: GNAT family N-acetyltransferase, partial [Micromonosporaceae bacterium]
MDPHAVLAAFDEQIRRRPSAGDRHVEQTENVIRIVSSWWAGVVWSRLDPGNADTVIAAEIERFTALDREWEWKHYSYDKPDDLPDRLRRAGFAPEPTEALMVAETAELALDVPPSPGVQLTPVVDRDGVSQLVAVHDEVFGGDHSAMGQEMLTDLRRDPEAGAAVVAMAGDTPVAGGRVEFHHGAEFASLWGGGTIADWRGRGVFRSLVAY